MSNRHRTGIGWLSRRLMIVLTIAGLVFPCAVASPHLPQSQRQLKRQYRALASLAQQMVQPLSKRLSGRVHPQSATLPQPGNSGAESGGIPAREGESDESSDESNDPTESLSWPEVLASRRTRERDAPRDASRACPALGRSGLNAHSQRAWMLDRLASVPVALPTQLCRFTC